MNTPKAIEKRLYSILAKHLGKHDYVLTEQYKQFRCLNSGGFQNIILSFSEYDNETLLEVNLGARIDLIEEVVQQFLADTPVDYRSHTNTVIVSIGKMSDLQYFRYKMATLEDVVDTSDQIYEFLQGRGFEFLENAVKMSCLNHWFNTHPQRPMRYIYNQVHRCFKGIAIARACNHPQFLTLIEVYAEQLARLGATEPQRLSYEKLVNYLLRYSFN